MELFDETHNGEVQDAPVQPGAIRVILADSQVIFRVGIRKILALEDGIRVVAQADSLEQLRVAIERHAPDVVLLEGELLAGNDSLVSELLRNAPDLKIIVQTGSSEQGQTVGLYRSGVRGIISRLISPDLLARCIRCISAGETWIENQAVNWVLESYRAQEAALLKPRQELRLSPREKQVIAGITRGMRNKEIAFEIGTTEQVIKNYLRKIYDKLGVSDRLELALYCLQNKIIKTDADEVAQIQRLLVR